MSIIIQQHGSIQVERAYLLKDAEPPDMYTLSLHDALPILQVEPRFDRASLPPDLASSSKKPQFPVGRVRSEEHTSELQSRRDLVCRLLLEKKNSLKICNDLVGNTCSALRARCSHLDRQIGR